MSRVSLVVIALVVGSPPASAQTPPPGGVFGRVLAAATGQPIRRAQVTLTIPGSNPSFRQREHRRRRPLPSSPICFIDAANASYDFGTAGKAHTNVDIVVSNSARVRLVRATPDGAFRAGHLPPGEYWVRAITCFETPAESGQWQDRETLARLSSEAERVRVVDGQAVTVTLRP